MNLLSKFKKIISKKFNIKKDLLVKRFNINSNSYYYTKIIDGKEITIDTENLDLQSKKILHSENKKLQSDAKLLEKETETYYSRQRFEYLKSLGYSCNSFEYLGEVKGTISEDLKSQIYPIIFRNDALIGIHRVGESFSSNNLQDVFSNGLIINGHLQGAAQNTVSLNDSVSYYPNNKTILKELMYADQYKNSKGSLLIMIPDDKLKENSDILINDGSQFRLNPKYIVGYVPLESNHHIRTIINNTISFNLEQANKKR